MHASIILCTHRSERYEDFVEAIDSLNAQSGENEKLEIVVVVDGNRELYDMILKSGIEEADKVEVKVILNEENMGLSETRNKGIKEAKGDVIAFFDDDAVAAGGKLLPFWTNENFKADVISQ